MKLYFAVPASGIIFEEETSSCLSSPLAPLPEHSGSRTVSPLYLRLGWLLETFLKSIHLLSVLLYHC